VLGLRHDPLSRIILATPPCSSEIWKTDEIAWGSSGKEARLLVKFCRLLSHMKQGDRGLLLSMAQEMAKSKKV